MYLYNGGTTEYQCSTIGRFRPTRYRYTGSSELLHHAFGSVGGSCCLMIISRSRQTWKPRLKRLKTKYSIKKIKRRMLIGLSDRQRSTCTCKSWHPLFWTICLMPYMFMHPTSPADTVCRIWRSATTISAYSTPIYSMTLWTEKRHDCSCRFTKTFYTVLLDRPDGSFFILLRHKVL